MPSSTQITNPVARAAKDVGAANVELTIHRPGAKDALDDSDLNQVEALHDAMTSMQLRAMGAEVMSLADEYEAMPAKGSGATMSRADLGRVLGKFEDMLDTMHTVGSEAQEQAPAAGATLSHRVAKHRRQVWYGMVWDSVLELLNEVGDVLFLIFKLPAHVALFWWSLAALSFSLLARLLIGLRAWGRVDWEVPKKRRWFAGGLATMLIEPLAGGRMIKRALKTHAEEEGERTYDTTTYAYVTAERQRDQRAVRAENDLTASVAELRNSVVLVVGEDLQEFAIELIFLAKTDGLDWRSIVGDPLLMITTVGTLVHMVRQLAEAWALYREIPVLRRIAKCRDKRFAKGATDDDVARFAQDAGAEARLINLSECKQVTDQGVLVLAQQCPQLSSVNFYGCDKLTDGAASALAQHCPQL